MDSDNTIKNLLFLYPGPIFRPDLPNFMDKYAMLSQNFKGTIICWAPNKEFRDYKIGNFHFRGILTKSLFGVKNVYLTKTILALHMLIIGIYSHYKREKFNVIICYEPMLTGFVGVCLKYLLRCKLII